MNRFLENEAEPEKLVSAAIRVGGKVYSGGTHIQAFMRFYQDASVERGFKDRFMAGLETAETDGFLTSNGRFINREEAYELAHQAAQLKPAWQDRKFASDFTSSEKPKLDSGWLEGYADVPNTTLTALQKRLQESLPTGERVLVESILKSLSAPFAHVSN